MEAALSQSLLKNWIDVSTNGSRLPHLLSSSISFSSSSSFHLIFFFLFFFFISFLSLPLYHCGYFRSFKQASVKNLKNFLNSLRIVQLRVRQISLSRMYVGNSKWHVEINRSDKRIDGERKRWRGVGKKKKVAREAVKCAAINLTLYASQKINALSNFINSSLHNETRGERITFLNAAIMPRRLRTVIASIRSVIRTIILSDFPACNELTAREHASN